MVMIYDKPINQRFEDRMRWWFMPLHKQLAKAVLNRDHLLVDRLLARGANPNGFTKSGVTPARFTSPLHHACHLAEFHIATALLAEGASINLPDHLGRTPLHHWFRGVDEWLGEWWHDKIEKVMPSTHELGRSLVEKGAKLDPEGLEYIAEGAYLAKIDDQITGPLLAQVQQKTLNQVTPLVEVVRVPSRL